MMKFSYLGADGSVLTEETLLTATEQATETVEATTEQPMTYGERASTAGIVALEGMIVIFAVLALLWGMVELMHKLLERIPAWSDSFRKCLKPNKKPQPAEPAKAEESADAQPEAEETSDDGAIVAAIMAAVQTFRAEEGNTGAFRVVSFRKAAQRSNRF